MGTVRRSAGCAILTAVLLTAPTFGEPARPISGEAPQSADAAARNRRGEELAKQGQLDAAATEFRGATELDPDDPQGHSNLGLVLAAQGQLDAAIDALRVAVDLAPDLDAPHTGLGIVLAQQGQPDAALVEFREAVRLAPNLSATHFNLGNALMVTVAVDAAVAEFRTAIRINPNEPSFYLNLSGALRAQGNGVEAEAAEQQARDLAGDAAPARATNGADDVAELVLIRPRSTLLYHLELDSPDHLVGRRALVDIDLRKEDGVWSGWFGKDLELTGKADPIGDGEIRVTLTSLLWRGERQFTIGRTAAGDVEVQERWRTTRHFLSADATTLTTGSCGGGPCLRLTSDDGRHYEGQFDGIQLPNSLGYRLQAGGRLTPAATAREDPVLYVLLYVLGSSYRPPLAVLQAVKPGFASDWPLEPPVLVILPR